MNGRVLVVAGSDSGGGAGIQADIKTVTALGGYAATAITALTAQNTARRLRHRAGRARFRAPADGRRCSTISAPTASRPACCTTAPMIDAVADALDEPRRRRCRSSSIPVMIVDQRRRGCSTRDAVDALKRRLIARADACVTPNLPEAEALTGHDASRDARRHARAAAGAARRSAPRPWW